MSIDTADSLRQLNWTGIIKRMLSEHSASNLLRVQLVYEPEKDQHFLYLSRRHDDATVALPIDHEQLKNKGTLSWTEDDFALLVLFLG